jgi:hypothetical protein
MVAVSDRLLQADRWSTAIKPDTRMLREGFHTCVRDRRSPIQFGLEEMAEDVPVGRNEDGGGSSPRATTARSSF